MQISLPSRGQVIQAQRARGGRVAAVLPIHYPRELFSAFDILPVELWGPPRVDTGTGDGHLQAYTCSIVRSALSFVMDGGLGVVDVVVVPHACDSLQGLASLMLDFEPPAVPVLPFYIPRANRPVDAEFLAAEFRSLYEKLAELTGKRPGDDELVRATKLQEDADAALRELATERERLPLSDRAYYELVRSREYLPADEFLSVARTALDGACDEPAGRNGGLGLLLSGIVPEPMELFDAISDAGARVVADDFASCGRRLYPEGRGDEPFVRMAGRLLGGPPDPTRGTPIADRVSDLLSVAERTGARGAVIYSVKFCEPELFDVPLLVQGLKEGGLPSVVMEVDVSESLSGQTRTRLEAFVEMLS